MEYYSMLEPLTDELPKVRQAPADCAENIFGLVKITLRANVIDIVCNTLSQF